MPPNPASPSPDDLITLNGDHIVEGGRVKRLDTTSGFPVSVDARFSYIQELGHGGAGSTHQAFDSVLQRHVALKFLTSNSAQNAQLLLQEARAQAQLNHEHICPIFEVGESQGQVYLVMQYIDGQPLHKIAPSLTLEQKLLLLQQVCIGLQYAHSIGLLHRDIKPANILVERQASGRYKPYIIDFGLAHIGALHQNSLEQHSHKAGLGTPAYMAPEQFSQAAQFTDRRVDVYSVGATLFHVLSGEHLPVLHDNSQSPQSLQALINQQVEELATHVSADVQTLVATCLQPNLELRYPSARAVAEELTRYLNGEPLKAHHSKRYWLNKKIRKNKTLVALASAIVLTLAGSGGWSWYQSQQQQIRESLLQDFSSQVEQVEAQVRFTTMAPHHNIDATMVQWRQHITSLQQQAAQLGDIATGPAHYAVGRMHYALQEFEHAQQQLELAWKSGFQQPRVAYMLGLTLTELYQQESVIALNIESTKSREARLQQLDIDYRQPALNYLKHGAGETQFDSYGQALSHYLQKDYDKANLALTNANELPSWFYEQYRLGASIQLQLAEQHYNGAQKERAEALYKSAIAMADKGLNVAPNSMAMHNIKANILLRVVVNQSYDQGSPDQTIQSGLAATRLAAQVSENDFQNTILQGEFSYRLSDYLLTKNDTGLRTLNEQDIMFLERTLRSWPGNDHLLRLMGAAYYRKFVTGVRAGEYDEKAINAAMTSFNSISDKSKDFQFYADQGKLFLDIAKRRRHFGLTRSGFFKKAFASFEKAKQIGVENVGMHINYAAALLNLAKVDFNRNSTELLHRAKRELEIVEKDGRFLFATHFYLTRVYYELSELKLNNGELSKGNSVLALEHIAKALMVKGDNYYAWYELIRVRVLDIKAALLSQTIDNLGISKKVIELFDIIKGVQDRFPDHTYSDNNAAYELSNLAESYIRQNRPVEVLLNEAHGYLLSAQEIAPPSQLKLNRAYWLYLNAIAHGLDTRANLIESHTLLTELNYSDHWSLNLKGKVEYQLAKISGKEEPHWYQLSYDDLIQAVKLRNYQYRYHQDLYCLIQLTKDNELTLDEKVTPVPPPVSGGMTKECVV